MVLKSHPQYIRPVTVPVAVEIGIAGLTKDGDTKSCTWLELVKNHLDRVTEKSDESGPYYWLVRRPG
jgi:hypothetical protein